ncbi:hypothetical protein FM102_13085 [Corynebacterium glutamicum]|nr:hypothetical protein FM102_13085 [Corynebacterium glutamicum]
MTELKEGGFYRDRLHPIAIMQISVRNFGRATRLWWIFAPCSQFDAKISSI